MASVIDEGDDQGAGGPQHVPLEPYPAPPFQAIDQQGYEYPPRCVSDRMIGSRVCMCVVDPLVSIAAVYPSTSQHTDNRVVPPDQAFEAMVRRLDLMHHATKK